MKRIIFLILSLFLGIVLFVVAIQQAGVNDVVKNILSFSTETIVVFFLINFIAVAICGTCRWKMIIESQNSHKIAFFTVLRAKLTGFAVSYITPAALVGGEPVRAYMIKEESDYGWEKSFASVIIDQAIYFFALFLFMIVGFIFLIDHFSLPTSVFYGFEFIILTSFFIFYLFYSRVLNKNSDGHGFFMFIIKSLRLDRFKFINKKEKNIEKTEKIIANFFKQKRKIFLKAFILAIVEVVIYLALILIIIFNLGIVINFTHSLSVFFILTLTNFVPIPGSLGSFEAGLTFIFNLLDLGKSNGFAFSMIFRFINIILVFLGFLALIHFELKTISHSFSIDAPRALLKFHKFLVKIFYKK